MIKPLENVDLSAYSTMRLGGSTRFLLNINNGQEIEPAVVWAQERALPIIMIGSGSNIIWSNAGYPGLVLVNKIMGWELREQAGQILITVGAGESWDSVVARSVEQNLSGIEQLSLIPGSTGATPIQNVGAYGREIADRLVSVHAYDTHDNKTVVIPKIDCDFGYRASRFKTSDRGRFLITSITLALNSDVPQLPFYSVLQNYLDEHHINDYTPANIRQAVIAIRTSKLPDPAVVANCGSFFANPIISSDDLWELGQKFPALPHWDVGQNMAKVSAAWMLEYLGFKGYHDPETGMATWDKHALVFINEKARSTADLLAFKQKIVEAVQAKFGITLQQEPELI